MISLVECSGYMSQLKPCTIHIDQRAFHSFTGFQVVISRTGRRFETRSEDAYTYDVVNICCQWLLLCKYGSTWKGAEASTGRTGQGYFQMFPRTVDR